MSLAALPGFFRTFADIIRRANREVIDIHIHSYGDRATRLSLDAFEVAILAGI
jgi:hypothetical protein